MKLAKDSWYEFNKFLHAGRGMLIYSLIHICFPTVWNWVPFAIAVVFAIVYEFYDAHRGVSFSWKDVVCDILGAAFVLGLWMWRM